VVGGTPATPPSIENKPPGDLRPNHREKFSLENGMTLCHGGVIERTTGQVRYDA
jgi:hypothetical protein